MNETSSESWLDRVLALPQQLFHWVEGLADSPNGAVALFLISFAESSFFPIPPDVLLIPLCLGEPRLAFWFAGICSVGSILGGVAGYGIGYFGGRPVVKRLFSDEKVAAVERYFEKYNAWAVGIAGLTPLPYKIFTIAGGACAITFRTFLVASVLSRSIRFFAVAGLIYLYGEPINDFIHRYFNILSVIFVVILLGGFWLVNRLGKKAGAKQAAAGADEPACDVPAKGEGEA